MTRSLLLLILCTATGCSNGDLPVPEADREAFRSALAASRTDMAMLEACRDTGKLSAVEAREVEVRQAQLSFLKRDAARHRLGPDVKQVEGGQFDILGPLRRTDPPAICKLFAQCAFDASGDRGGGGSGQSVGAVTGGRDVERVRPA